MVRLPKFYTCIKRTNVRFVIRPAHESDASCNVSGTAPDTCTLTPRLDMFDPAESARCF